MEHSGKYEEKEKVLHVFSPPVFSNKTSSSLVFQPLGLKDGDGGQNEVPVFQGKMVSYLLYLLHLLDTQRSMGMAESTLGY